MYDFMVYGIFSSIISKVFFVNHSEYLSLIMTLAVFGVGFLMRPIGAVVLGSYTDRHGQRAGLILALGLMGLGTAMIALVPSYHSIGIAAPLIVLTGRLIQGFSAGVELGSVSTYLHRIAPANKKGLYVSWQSGSQQVAVLVAALIGAALNTHLSDEQMLNWGWRIPFFFALLLLPVFFWLRASMDNVESEQEAHHHRLGFIDTLKGLCQHYKRVCLGVMLVIMTTVSFYMITSYTATYGKQELHLSLTAGLVVTVMVAISNLVWLPIGGALSDRFGRRPLLIFSSVIMLVTAWPAMSWLVQAPDFSKLLLVELWLSFLYGIYNGAMIVTLAELMPAILRTTAFSLAYSLATSIFGGNTPLISTWLIHETGSTAAPAIVLCFAALIALVATLFLKTEMLKEERLKI